MTNTNNNIHPDSPAIINFFKVIDDDSPTLEEIISMRDSLNQMIADIEE